MVLSKMKKSAETELPNKAIEVGVTVPVDFDHGQD
jgi:molecular chaperone DnaK (HSP70)